MYVSLLFPELSSQWRCVATLDLNMSIYELNLDISNESSLFHVIFCEKKMRHYVLLCLNPDLAEWLGLLSLFR